MNKKVILFAPIAVLSMGLTSCNKWSSINNDKFIELANKIYENKPTEKSDVFNLYSSSEQLNYVTKGYYYSFQDKTFSYLNYSNSQSNTYEIDVENKYEKDHLNSTFDGVGYKSTYDEVNYVLFQNDYHYDLWKNTLDGDRHKCDVESFKNSIREYAYRDYARESAIPYLIISDPNTYLTESEVEKHKLEELKNGSFYNYYFESSGDSNLKLVLEFKILNQETEIEGEKTTIVSSYHKHIYQFENNLLTYSYTNDESTTKVKDKELYHKSEETINRKYNQKFSRDNVNVGDYSVTESE